MEDEGVVALSYGCKSGLVEVFREEKIIVNGECNRW